MEIFPYLKKYNGDQIRESNKTQNNDKTVAALN